MQSRAIQRRRRRVSRLAALIASFIEAAVALMAEVLKTLIREIWLTGAQFANGLSAALLHLVYKPYYHILRRMRLFERVKPVPQASEKSWWYSRRLAGLWTFVFPSWHLQSKMLKKPPSWAVHRPFDHESVYDTSVESLSDADRGTTGFFEDLQLQLQLFVDLYTGALRRMLMRILGVGEYDEDRSECKDGLVPRTAHETAVFAGAVRDALTVFKLRHPTLDPNYDSATESTIRAAGYSCERYEVVTEDGYIIRLIRIPRPGAKRVMYFQHGLMDSSSAWVATGGITGLAYRAHDKGYDVFLGNLRGFDATMRHTNPKMTWREYWDFTVNEFGNYDIGAFVTKIRQIKAGELEPETQPVITAAGHSMGCAALLMYVTQQLHDGRPHHLSRCIFLSPAGVHAENEWNVFLGLKLAEQAAKWVSNFQLPTGSARLFFAKILQDLCNGQATMDLFSLLVSAVVGGSMETSVFRVVDFGCYSNSVISAKVMLHGIQCAKVGRFQYYDFGDRRRNRHEYGADHPPDILERYKLVDIPMYFLGGGRDKLIPVSNVLAHYHAVREAHPDLAHVKLFPELNHMDFTLSLDDSMLAYVTSLM